MSSPEVVENTTVNITEETKPIPEEKIAARISEPIICFSVNEKIHNLAISASEPAYNQPPPNQGGGYYQGHVGGTPVYRERVQGYPQDVSRSPTVRANPRRDPFDPDDLPYVRDAFGNNAIRNQFVQKVYTILSVQLLITFGFIVLAIHVDAVRHFMQRNPGYLILAMVFYFVLLIMLTCYDYLRRDYPLNFVLLFLFTLSMAYMTAAISCYYRTPIVMFTIGVTAAVCILISVLACQTKYDVTECGCVFLIIFMILIIFGIIATIVMIVTGSNVLYLIYACLITLLICGYLMMDTQLIMGGRRIELSPEEYVYAAFQLYIDIMLIFQYLLLIFASCDN